MTDCQPITDPGHGLHKEPIESYESRRGQFLTAHGLIKFMQSPAKFNNPEPQEYRASNVIGSAIHACVLEGPSVFRKRYRIGSPINPSFASYGMDSQSFESFAAGDPFVVTPTVAAMVGRVYQTCMADPDIVALLYRAKVELTVRTVLNGHEFQGRLDAKGKRGIVDLKTITDLDQAAYQIELFKYANQMACYRDAAEQATKGKEILPVTLIFVEKHLDASKPIRTKIYEFSEAELYQASADNKVAMRALQRCKETNVWPETFDLEKERWL